MKRDQLEALTEECQNYASKEESHMAECLTRAMDLNLQISGLSESYSNRMFTDDSTNCKDEDLVMVMIIMKR